jgi:phosphatidate phosphatase APP1
MEHADRPRWRARIARRLQGLAVGADDAIDAAMRRLDARLGWRRPQHIAAYRGYADARGVELVGRVLANRPLGGPDERDDWWDNLLNTYRRFDSSEVAGAALLAHFGDAVARIETAHEGYYQLHLPPQPAREDALWTHARIALADGTLETRQPVLQVLPRARIGILSDIDDTILESSITHWKTAAQLTFLHNARTRKPLPGVAKLYAALQAGADRANCHPLFYVSSSPWNLYDLLDDFLELNAIPPGPMFLRDFGLDTGKFINTPGHGHKLERARELIARMPQLRWVLLGDSGQADAELYAEAAREFGERIAAIYIRDVEPGSDSVLDRGVDAWIERVAGTRVPMLRAADSLAIATHAAGIGLIDPAALPAIAAEVQRDLRRPSLGEAALEGVEAHAPDEEADPPG